MNATATRLDPEAFRDVAPASSPQDTLNQMRRLMQNMEQTLSGATEEHPADDATNTSGKPARRRRAARQATERSTTMTAQGNTNAPKWEELVEVARDLGKQAGQGKDVQIKFGLKVIEAAYLGSLSLDLHKHGQDRRDGVVLAEEYVKAQNGAVVFDAKAPNQRKLISNLDKCIKLGSNPKWGQGEPLQTVNRLLALREQLKKKGTKVQDAFNTLMKFATQQLKRDRIMDDAELQQFIVVSQPDARSGEDILEAVRRTLTKLKDGKVPNCPDIDTSKEVSDAISLMTKRLTAIAKAKGGQKAA